MAIDPNKPVFARSAAEHSQGGHYEQDGLTIRQHFAALAMQGMLASQGSNGEYYKHNELVKEAVWYADALLAELAKDGQP